VARNLLAASLLLLAAGACSSGSDKAEAEQDAARMAQLRARTDSVRQARQKADSLELARFTACSDSVKGALGATPAGRKKLAAPLADGQTLPEIAGACGQGTATTAAGAAVAAPAGADSQAASLPTRAETSAATPAVDADGAPVVAGTNSDIAAAGGTRSTTEVVRESFAYGGGSRDPFASLMNAKNVGPDLADLQLVGVYQDLRAGSNSVAVLREKVTSKRHKLRVGDQIGRLRLAQIRPHDVVFAIADFGYERQETLSLRTQEDVTP
jgi:hypothetical protein